MNVLGELIQSLLELEHHVSAGNDTAESLNKIEGCMEHAKQAQAEQETLLSGLYENVLRSRAALLEDEVNYEDVERPLLYNARVLGLRLNVHPQSIRDVAMTLERIKELDT